jgi:hypothetical protein
MTGNQQGLMAPLPMEATGQEKEEEAEVVVEEEEDYDDLSSVAPFLGTTVCCTGTT